MSSLPTSGGGKVILWARSLPSSNSSFEQLSRRAVASHRAGRFEEAEGLYRAMLAVRPNDFHAAHMLGVLAGQRGKIDLAIEFLERAVAVRPRDAESVKNLGIAYTDAGRLADAVRCLEGAIAVDPRLAEAHHQLGYILEAQGEATRAISAYRQALAVQPNRANTQNNLAALLISRNELKEPETLLRSAIALKPSYAEAHNNLANLLAADQREAEAESLFRKAVALRPGYAEAYSNLGNLLRTQNRSAEAMNCYREAIAANPKLISVYWSLATLLEDMNKPEAAEGCLRAAVAVDPKSDKTSAHLGALLRRVGRFDEALAALGNALELEPNNALVLHNIVESKKISAADQDILNRMNALLARDDLTSADRATLHFGLGKAYDDLANYKRALHHYDIGNKLKRQIAHFDRAAHSALIDSLINTFTPHFFASHKGLGGVSDRPLFIVGMMRSGTTLTEQILAKHPDVAAGGELDFWGKREAALGIADICSLCADAARSLSEEYMRVLDDVSSDARRVTDKMPHNFLRLGFIHMLFPGARIVHCRRNPADTGLSLYFTLFAADHNFVYDREDIVFFYHQYARLMAHWQRVLPSDRLLDVKYETLVADPLGTARRLVAFAGLEWHDSIGLSRNDDGRLIRTASAWQARQPIYGTSVERWRRYESSLGALRQLLDDPHGS